MILGLYTLYIPARSTFIGFRHDDIVTRTIGMQRHVLTYREVSYNLKNKKKEYGQVAGQTNAVLQLPFHI